MTECEIVAGSREDLIALTVFNSPTYLSYATLADLLRQRLGETYRLTLPATSFAGMAKLAAQGNKHLSPHGLTLAFITDAYLDGAPTSRWVLMSSTTTCAERTATDGAPASRRMTQLGS